MSSVITTILHIRPGQKLALPAKFKLAGIIVANNEILQIKHSSRHDIANLSWLKLLTLMENYDVRLKIYKQPLLSYYASLDTFSTLQSDYGLHNPGRNDHTAPLIYPSFFYRKHHYK